MTLIKQPAKLMHTTAIRSHEIN